MGTWAIPNTIERLDSLADLMRRGAVEAHDVYRFLEDKLGDDQLFDKIDIFVSNGLGMADVRPEILEFLLHLVERDEVGEFPATFADAETIAATEKSLTSGWRSQLAEHGLVERMANLCAELAESIPSVEDRDRLLGRQIEFLAMSCSKTIH